ncbi:siphovirus Gp157 family protein [Aerococcaceae bacterium NML210727]|nr:siphovirus Gp157 family protein [Aerococcaceae bacterium NML210727]MCW6655063.1 siphovirus Gp157 family protein [Aerococcaceae bacterium NML201296]
MNLYDLQEAFRNIEALIDNAEPEDDLTHLREAMEIIEASIEDKVQAYAFVIKNFTASIEALEKEEKRLKQKREQDTKRRDNLKNILHQFMLEQGKTKYAFPQFTVSIRNNAESVKVLDEAKVPKEYFVQQEPKLSKTLIKEALKGGIEVEGAQLTRTQSLQIR